MEIDLEGDPASDRVTQPRIEGPNQPRTAAQSEGYAERRPGRGDTLVCRLPLPSFQCGCVHAREKLLRGTCSAQICVYRNRLHINAAISRARGKEWR